MQGLLPLVIHVPEQLVPSASGAQLQPLPSPCSACLPVPAPLPRPARPLVIIGHMVSSSLPLFGYAAWTLMHSLCVATGFQASCVLRLGLLGPVVT